MKLGHHNLFDARYKAGINTGGNPEELTDPAIAGQLAGHLPDRMIRENGTPYAAPQGAGPGPQVETREQMVDEALAEYKEGLLTDSNKMYDALGFLILTALLHDEIDLEAAKANLPFNSGQLRAAGYSVLRTCRTVREAVVMRVDLTQLGRRLAMGERIRRLKAIIGPVADILDANESQQLVGLEEQVTEGLGRVKSLLPGNALLARGLAPALALRGGPADQGLQSRGDNERLVEKTLAEEHAKSPGHEGTGGTGGTTTTVTTQTPGVTPAGTPSTPKAPPHASHGGTHKKPPPGQGQ